jgi:hypothetical protein
MNLNGEKGQKGLYLTGVLGLGLFFTAIWSALLAFVPPSAILTILNYVMYFMSVFVVALPTHTVLKLYIRKSTYAVIAAALVWAVWTFGIRFLFVWLLTLIRGQ